MSTSVKKVDNRNSENKLYATVLNYVSVALIVIGVALYYMLKINIWLKWSIVIVAVVLAFLIFFLISPTGLSLHGFLRDAWRELSKAAWPSRKEALQFTWMVFIFVIVLAFLLWFVDSFLSWLFYSIILGRGH